MWCGLILKSDDANPNRPTLNVYPSQPVTIRVTQGPNRTPIAGASLYLTSRGQVEWVDRNGAERSGSAGVSRWLTTDTRGEARGNVGLGPHEVRVWMGEEDIGEQQFAVNADEPVVVEFHHE